MPYTWVKKFLIVSFVALLLSACEQNLATNDNDEAPVAYQYQMPAFKSDGWQVGHLTDQGMDEEKITQLVRAIQQGQYRGIDSLSIVRNEKLLFHEDFRSELSVYDNWIGNTNLEQHIMHSAAKSFTSALFGIALEQGFIQSVEQPLLPLLDYAEYSNWDNQKNEISLKHLLSMQTGIEWDEWHYPFGDQRNSLSKLSQSNDDYLKTMLDLPMASAPGTEFTYNTVATIALGKVIENSVGLSLEDFAQQFLFEPLQINTARWLYTPGGSANTGSGLFLATRDMAKLGQLYLNNGKWNGYPLLSPEWVKQSTLKQVSLDWQYTSGYGYQWWLGDFQQNNTTIPFYSARGYGGQFIIVVPQKQLVVAFTAHNYDNDLYELPLEITEQLILTAVAN